MNLPERYVVKVPRGGSNTLVFLGTKARACEHAAEMNDRYQTDEYFVEEFDVNKLKGFEDVE